MTVPTYLVAAYLVFWLVPFALVLATWQRQQRLERQIEALRQALPPQREAGEPPC